ncbi:MAG: hypothetical protein KIT18_09345 [Burkholderiales bacterium]|nr:hypothetical protein [Burkholderiales bacterium]
MEPWRGAHDPAYDEAYEELTAAGLTDGLPVVPPTAERIARMLDACGLDAEAVVATLPPLLGAATWHDIAFNAVMAGCLPGHLPLVGTALAALADDDFNLLGIATTTGSVAPLVIVNGPAADRAGMNAQANALGPGNRANAAIGRAVQLAIRNIGGAAPGSVDMATLGQPAKYTFCCAENETENPWEPLHVERGFPRESSVVTVVGAAGSVEVVDSDSATGDELARVFAQSMLIAGSVGGTGGFLGSGQPLIILPPEHAAAFSADGWSKAELKRAIYDGACLPLEHLPPGMRNRIIEHRTQNGVADPRGPLRAARSPDDVLIVVAGGFGRKAAYVPTWSGVTRAVSRAVPD